MQTGKTKGAGLFVGARQDYARWQGMRVAQLLVIIRVTTTCVGKLGTSWPDHRMEAVGCERRAYGSLIYFSVGLPDW